MSGIHRGEVVSADDPDKLGRVLVSVPSLWGDHICSEWAWPILTGGNLSVPEPGAQIVIQKLEDACDGPLYYHGTWPVAVEEAQQNFLGRTAEKVAIADAAANAAGIPPALLRAIIDRESAWNETAYNRRASRQQWKKYVAGGRSVRGTALNTHALAEDSTKWGAYGMCQVMLVTAIDRGFAFGANAEDLYDPATNCALAAKLLRIFWDRSGHNVRQTAAAFHSGWGNAKGPDPSTWARDSQTYSRDVLRFYVTESQGTPTPASIPSEAYGANAASAHLAYKGISKIACPELRGVNFGQGIFDTILGRPTEALEYSSVSLSQPQSFASSDPYPHNKVKFTLAGHREELDDTPGHERRAWFHPAGAFEEVGPGGQKSSRSSAEFRIIDGPDNKRSGSIIREVRGKKRESVSGDYVTDCGRMTLHTSGGYTQITRGKYDVQIRGDAEQKVRGSLLLKSTSPMDLVSTQIGLTAADDIQIMACSGDLGLVAANSIKLSVAGTGLVDVGASLEFLDPLGVQPVFYLGSSSLVRPDLNMTKMPLLNTNVLTTIASLFRMGAGPLGASGAGFTLAATVLEQLAIANVTLAASPDAVDVLALVAAMPEILLGDNPIEALAERINIPNLAMHTKVVRAN